MAKTGVGFLRLTRILCEIHRVVLVVIVIGTKRRQVMQNITREMAGESGYNTQQSRQYCKTEFCHLF